MNSYVTLTSPSFVPGTIALWKSLRRFTKFHLHAMSFDLSLADSDLLASHGIQVHPVETIPNSFTGGHTGNKERFHHTYTKLRAFSLTQYDKIIFLDSDTLVLKSIDSLFAIEGFGAAPDAGKFANEHRFNSGVFVTRPNEDLFNSMLRSLSTIRSYDNSDQGFLNEWFVRKWVRLDPSFNTLKRVYQHRPRDFRLDKIKVLHFVGVKPWDCHGTLDAIKFRSLHRIWQSVMDGKE